MSPIFCIENILYRVEKGSGDFSPTNKKGWEAQPYLVTPEKPTSLPKIGTLEAIKWYNFNQ
ncbi:hypothetical protein [Sulfurovum sp.]|jgi:hypothetical protein|uniref:hypothetical protein n=1 Tax=Sulfurovum sp. TaxID=1969726 RepID=UPI002A35AA51|nr:hypothetical protein [Sulfurovum sp.]MDY0402607.1 hypothetical protein [Sulfurovum sp.]